MQRKVEIGQKWMFDYSYHYFHVLEKKITDLPESTQEERVFKAASILSEKIIVGPFTVLEIKHDSRQIYAVTDNAYTNPFSKEFVIPLNYDYTSIYKEWIFIE